MQIQKYRTAGRITTNIPFVLSLKYTIHFFPKNPITFKSPLKENSLRMTRNIPELKIKSICEWLEKHKYDHSEKLTYDVDCQTESRTQADRKADTKEISTQIVEERLLSGVKTTEDSQKFCEQAELEWDASVYASTKVQTGNPFERGD
ncbi:hypothetical protein HHI36_008037 [Cryptolaemus montrouzieri]|uniref:Uncharacterized protein n=1 Tax=Cryptolaemus montrouzieri TaxID=559131 RepID=A0ABD2MR70_9CUCU